MLSPKMPSSKIKNTDFHAREPALKKDILMQGYLSIFATVTVKLKMSPRNWQQQGPSNTTLDLKSTRRLK